MMNEGLARAFDAYADAFSQEAETATVFRGFLGSSAHAFERSHLIGHFTGSA